MSALLPESSPAAPAVNPSLQSVSRKQGHRIERLSSRLSELQFTSSYAAAAEAEAAAIGAGADYYARYRTAGGAAAGLPYRDGPASPAGRCVTRNSNSRHQPRCFV